MKKPTKAVMSFPAVLSAVSRSVRYFDGVRFRFNGIHLRRPRAHVAFNMAFFRSAISAVCLYTYIVGLRASRILRGVRHDTSIAFYPQSAAPWYNIWIVSQFAPVSITSDIKSADRIFAFEDETRVQSYPELSEFEVARLINHRINDISKRRVADVFKSIFRYDLDIDPATYNGPAVCKSQTNGVHDGVIVECPLAPEEIKTGYAYQKLIDSTFNGRTSEDLRISFVFGKIPVVFHKHKLIEKRFGTEYLSVDVKDAGDVFSSVEIENIIEFCREIGLDFGSIDMMRDKHDGKIYIVDVNKTCMPVLCLSLKEQNRAMRRIADAFADGVGAGRASS
ncbi:MAG: hypothetical protein KJN99_09555 [Marinicaulis sp.]|nr:hypothetical protein [Marinicaulis sp.]